MFILFAFFCFGSAFSQEKTYAQNESEESIKLFNTIAGLDSTLFGAYNNCTQGQFLDQYASLFSEDLEFYHDKGGFSTSKGEMVDGVKNHICGKVQRELLKGSIEVSPVPGFGAIEIGSHRFHNLVEKSTSQYSRFVIVWHFKNDEWIVTRVISLHK